MTQAAKADPGDGITQAGIASDHAKQALLGSGVQNIYFGERDQAAEPAISLAPPFGLRDDKLPIRGRDALLDELTNPDPIAPVHLVHGLGGCGKTRLALEVAYRAESSGVEVWWVAATEESGFLAVVRSLGRRLGVTDDELRHGDAADLIWQRLLARAEPWLLVIDNADEPAILAGAGSSVGEGRGWVRRLPTGSAGRVLITSRDGNAETWGGWCRTHRVGMLADDPAATMLADYSGHHPSLGSDEKLLAARLGGLPLALKIAGSYLAQSASIPAAFADPGTIATYRDYRAAIDATSPTGQLTPDQALTLIGQTWDLTLNRLDARRLPEARRLLRLLACFADAPIPYELLLHPTTLAESNEFAGVTGSRLWQALAALDDCGLIDLTRPAEPEDIAVLRLHPLVRDTSRPSATDLMPILAIAASLAEWASTNSLDTGRPEDPSTWPTWRLLASHAEYVFATMSALPECTDDTAKSASYAAYHATRYMANQGLYTAAETQYRNILTTRLRVLGPDHEDTLATRHSIAYVMAGQGNHTAAETEYRDILTRTLRVFGPDHPDTLATRHEIARVMAEQGNHTAAETECRDILDTRLRVYGPDHPDTLTTRHEIARVMAKQGNHAAAETEFRDILTARLRVLGPDHPHTLTTRHNIAYVMAEQGNHTAAETEFGDILTSKLRVLGPDHPSTKMTARWVAYLQERRAKDSGTTP